MCPSKINYSSILTGLFLQNVFIKFISSIRVLFTLFVSSSFQLVPMAVLRRFDSSIFQYFLFVLFMTPLSGRKVSSRACAGVLEQLMSAPIYIFEGFLQWRAEFQSSVSIFSTVFYCLLREVERRHDVIYLVCTSYLDAKVARISMRC